MNYGAENLLVRSTLGIGEFGIINSVSATKAGWKFLNAEIRRFEEGATWTGATGEFESVMVILGGRCSVESDKGEWLSVGRRPNVFAGMPYALYLPRHTQFTLQPLTEVLEIAHCWVPTDEDHRPQLVTPEQSKIEIRGGGNATRQINGIIPPGFECHRIVCVEVYTPGGNWSSYPGHKHDVHTEDGAGNLSEADLEEIYYYKIDKPQGFAIQRVYTTDRSIDAVMVVADDDIVLIPEGYHPVSAAHGYNCYYLNFLAGSAQSLANVDDPEHEWIKETWPEKDPRVPLVTHDMEIGGGASQNRLRA